MKRREFVTVVDGDGCHVLVEHLGHGYAVEVCRL